MKKFFKIVGIIILILVAIVGIAAAVISFKGIPTYEVNVPQIQPVTITPERIERGQKIASMLCKDCHYNPQTNKLTGRLMNEVSEFGEIHSQNLTSDKKYGIGNWTDAQLIYFIRTGIHPFTGKYVPPYMPKLMHMADEDLYSVIAFLRSDNEMVKADTHKEPQTTPSFLTKALSNTVFKPYAFPDKPIPMPDTTNKLELGKYLTLYQLECYTCHSGDFTKMDVGTPENSFLFFGGGNKMKDAEGHEVMTLNITPDEETGIGKWTEEDFVKAVKYGIVPNGPALRKPMQPYAQLTDDEVKAIYAYLKTVPKINHKVERKF